MIIRETHFPEVTVPNDQIAENIVRELVRGKPVAYHRKNTCMELLWTDQDTGEIVPRTIYTYRNHGSAIELDH